MIPLWVVVGFWLALTPWVLAAYYYGQIQGQGRPITHGTARPVGALMLCVDGQTILADIQKAILYTGKGSSKTATLLGGRRRRVTE